MADDRINPEVPRALSDLSPLRVQETAEQDSPRHFWSALKNGHYRFALAGVAVSVPISAALGLAVAAAFSLTAAPVMLGFIGAGALLAAEAFGNVGAAAASRASGLAEKHARILDAEVRGDSRLSALDDHLMNNGRGHHFQFPENRDEGKFFSWKSGLAGGALGVASGGVLGGGGAALAAHLGAGATVAAALGHAPLLGVATPAVAAVVGTSAAAVIAPFMVAGALAFGLYGLTFGIERKVFKTFINHTDAQAEGKLKFNEGLDIGKLQSQETETELAQHRVRRQAEIERLEKSYNEKIAWSAMRSRLKGIAGGAIPGVLIGAVAGGIALLATSGMALSFAPALIPAAFAAAGGLIGIRLFGESATEAGAEATARAIDNEFERNRALRAKGIMPPAPEKAKETWINPKTMMITGALGAAVGIALMPVIGAPLAGLAGLHLAGAALVEMCALAGGIVGASFGVGNKTLKTLAKPVEWAYDKVSFSQDDQTLALPPFQAKPALQSAPALDKVTVEDMNALNRKIAAKDAAGFANALNAQMQASPASIHV